MDIERNTQPGFDAKDYLAQVREAYQDNILKYEGRRSEDQAVIAECLSDEADEHINIGLAAFSNMKSPLPPTEARIEKHISSQEEGERYFEIFNQMKAAFRQVYVAIGISTMRAEEGNIVDTDKKPIRSLWGLSNEERIEVMQQLFNDFQEHNALQFGAIGSGAKKRVMHGELDEDGNYVYVEVDRDKVSIDRLLGVMATTPYTYGTIGHSPLVHTAGKLSPADRNSLRREYPDVPKDVFDRLVNSHRDPGKKLAEPK